MRGNEDEAKRSADAVVRRGDTPKVFFERYYGEKIDLKYVKIMAGGGEPFTMLHLSDSLDPKALADALSWASKNVRGSLVVHCGDAGGPPPEGALFAPGEKDPVRVPFAAKVVNGVGFVLLDDSSGTVTREQAASVRVELAKGLPVVLCCHVPFYSDGILAAYRACAPASETDVTVARQRTDGVTQEFFASLRKEPLLKGILAGHLGISAEDAFSPTAMQYVVGANTNCAGEEVLFA